VVETRAVERVSRRGIEIAVPVDCKEEHAMGAKCNLKPGDVINRTYEAVRLLGSGYSGEVWEARHLFLDSLVALKLMHPEDRDDLHPRGAGQRRHGGSGRTVHQQRSDRSQRAVLGLRR
jgi:hypothetical protein